MGRKQSAAKKPKLELAPEEKQHVSGSTACIEQSFVLGSAAAPVMQLLHTVLC